ncbi:MAG: 50S ribosomal protein L11 methyltransferase [Epsilonproteobacteria bacterium]|nr:50S ribosomal protein L11 methyltransferase [Campylobacterota bacterium]
MSEHYYELVVKLSSHHALFSEFLSDTLPIGFEESDDGFIIRSEEDIETIQWGLEQFREALQKALGVAIEMDCKLSKLENSDWVQNYKDSIKPLAIEQFYIHPTWDEDQEGYLNITIDPALAFGTGHHPTTASVLKAIARYVHQGDTVLDVGCGSGILSIAAMQLGAIVDGCDTDAVSVSNAQENAKLNNLTFHALWEGSCSHLSQQYDVVVANIVADVLIFLAKDLKQALKPDGVLVLSGILDKYENKVIKMYSDCEIVEKITQDEWVSLILKKR